MRKFLVLGSALALLACVPISRGRPIDFDLAQQLVPGKSTRSDAERIFGPPTSAALINGTIVLTWIHTKAFGGNASSQVLQLFFDVSGTYTRYGL